VTATTQQSYSTAIQDATSGKILMQQRKKILVATANQSYCNITNKAQCKMQHPKKD
jgi:hypothetical protein